MAAQAVQYLGNIWIWEESVAYRHEVEKVLALIRTAQAGQTLIKHINSKNGYMLIVPYEPTKDFPVGAETDPVSQADGTARGLDVRPPGEAPFTGTGKGSDTEIYYHPANLREANKRRGYIAAGYGPGEALFHEMIHGLRQLSGVRRPGETVIGEENTMHSVEELYAIMAANVYRSDRGFTVLRADHRMKSPPLRDARVYQSYYYEHYQTYIDKWFNEQREFCLDMSHVTAKFNPFREAAVRLGFKTGSAVSMRL
jgi:hypothetical protein